MNERYARIYALPGKLYAEDSPIMVISGVLLYDKMQDRVLALAKYKNISGQEIQAIKITVRAFDAYGRELVGFYGYTYDGLAVENNGEFGNKKAIPLPNKQTNSFCISVDSVLFSDGSTWNCTTFSTWKLLSKQNQLSDENNSVYHQPNFSETAYYERTSPNYGWGTPQVNVDQTNRKTPIKQKKNRSKLFISVAAIVAVIAVGVFFVFIAPKIFVSVEDLCAQGNYEKAYEKAVEDEKIEIKAENAAAVNCIFIVEEAMKNPNSFKLHNVYYKESINDDGYESRQLVLVISGTNSYGGTVSSYFLFTRGEEKEWEFFASVSDLVEEEISEYDDEDEAIEKIVDNLARVSIESTIDGGIKLSKAAIKRINDMYEADVLYEVELLDVW